ncbi:outer membrane beta-barrel protein [Bdellovibrio sp. KM01]|uniref:outer membrane beta-barrel protein n=1 Tax=Bdellovibrio sp. KM01 TaxID=2748865 RepID=UPI0015E9E559|nr:outer membrane beta-barrel protein [Bdellovibrio sp. KM01]QLY25741.1 outer membrane beta-barrel protein [Bdellovibrio sp. KM01]
MKFLKLAFTAAILLFSAQAMATGFYFEPAVFYESGAGKVDVDDSDATTKGMGLDLKLGMHFVEHMLFVGLDGSYSKPKFKHDNTGYEADATSSTYGAIIGVQTPLVGLRFWAGYVFGGTLDPEESGLFDVKFDEAKGPKVGLGIKIFFIAVNFEYMDLKYSKGTGNWGSIPSLDDFGNKVSMISVSVPFMF